MAGSCSWIKRRRRRRKQVKAGGVFFYMTQPNLDWLTEIPKRKKKSKS